MAWLRADTAGPAGWPPRDRGDRLLGRKPVRPAGQRERAPAPQRGAAADRPIRHHRAAVGHGTQAEVLLPAAARSRPAGRSGAARPGSAAGGPARGRRRRPDHLQRPAGAAEREAGRGRAGADRPDRAGPQAGVRARHPAPPAPGPGPGARQRPDRRSGSAGGLVAARGLGLAAGGRPPARPARPPGHRRPTWARELPGLPGVQALLAFTGTGQA